MQHFLVVIDTTTMPNEIKETDREGHTMVRRLSLTKGIQNFYIILAPDAQSAKMMVVNTFRQKPNVMMDVQRSISVTPMGAIMSLLKGNNNAWSYIPIGGTRAPGQQKTSQTIQQMREDDRRRAAGQEIPPSQVHPERVKFQAYDSQIISADDGGVKLGPGEITKEDEAVLRSSTSSSAAKPEGMDEATYQQFLQFQKFQAMQNGDQPQPQSEPKVDLTKHNPNNDPELAARIRANAAAGPEIIHDDAPEASIGNDLPDIEVDADAEVEVPDGWNDDLTDVDKE